MSCFCFLQHIAHTGSVGFLWGKVRCVLHVYYSVYKLIWEVYTEGPITVFLYRGQNRFFYIAAHEIQSLTQRAHFTISHFFLFLRESKILTWTFHPHQVWGHLNQCDHVLKIICLPWRVGAVTCLAIIFREWAVLFATLGKIKYRWHVIGKTLGVGQAQQYNWLN